MGFCVLFKLSTALDKIFDRLLILGHGAAFVLFGLLQQLLIVCLETALTESFGVGQAFFEMYRGSLKFTFVGGDPAQNDLLGLFGSLLHHSGLPLVGRPWGIIISRSGTPIQSCGGRPSYENKHTDTGQGQSRHDVPF